MRSAEQEAGQTLWLSRGFEELLYDLHRAPQVFDVVIVGSGYGGAVAAAELAGWMKPGKDGKDEPLSVLVLERGKEYLSGMFPARLADLPGHVRFSAGASQPAGRREGLFDIRVGPDVNAVLANGLGGGSLINAGVMKAPELSAFQGWPGMVGAELTVAGGFLAEAATLLGAAGNTIGKLGTPKLDALGRLGRVDQAPITVSLQAKNNLQDVPLGQCKLCGDCATGCNHGAKNSLDVSLLAAAWRRDARIVTGATVLRIERAPGGTWLLHTVHTDGQLRERQGEAAKLKAHKLILAAGTFGSTEILLRSRSERLAFSPQLGQRFSSNGDTIAVIYGQHRIANAVSDESVDPDDDQLGRKVGPTITGILDLRDARGRGHVIEEIAIPGALRRAFEETVTTVNLLHELEHPDKDPHRPERRGPARCAVPAGAIARSSVVVMMGDDGADGALELIGGAESTHGDGAVCVRWPALSNHPLFESQIATLRKLVEDSGSGGRVLPNPVWQILPDKMQFLFDSRRGPPLTVHPLGGCPMGKDARDGVVNHLGQVFDTASGAPHRDLVVLDGSIVRSALGVNPALTIAALALRAVRQLRHGWGYAQPQGAPKPMPVRQVFRHAPAAETPRPTEVKLVERMSGDALLKTKDGGPLHCRVDLTLRFREHPIAALVLPQKGAAVPMMRELDLGRGELRVFRKKDWRDWRRSGGTEAELDDLVALRAPLGGKLKLLHREASEPRARTCRAWRAWLLNRGLRDSLQWIGERWDAGELFTAKTWQYVRERSASSRALSSRAGEVRLLEYVLYLKDDAVAGKNDSGLDRSHFKRSAKLIGRKRLTYERKGNPWRQLMQLELDPFDGLASGRPRLELDAKFLADRGVPLLKIVRQNDQVSALADVVSFAAYFLRLLINIHVWSFRRPEAPAAREPQRLPAGIPGRLPEPEIRELALDQLNGAPVRVRLTRYRPRNLRGRPVVMIHGYSASGTTFAHHAIRPISMAEYFYHRGRDVWVLDLRTSSGMPTARHFWKFEDAALADLPAAFDEISRLTSYSKLDVFAHCMGSAMFSMAVLAPPKTGDRFYRERLELPDRIHRAVLCQIAPVVVMSPANIFRGYAMGYLRHLLPFANYEFRVGPNPGLTDQLIDRLLATLPYPKHEFSIENPIRPWGSTAFTGTRHRMDALYGRDFSLADRNGVPLLADTVLEYIDDLFGPLNTDTVAQAIHFARTELVTNHAGRNEYVLPANFPRWKFPTLSIHGEENGLSDIATLARFCRKFKEDADIDIETCEFKGFGHQDSLIGRKAGEVFDHVFDYLEKRGRYAQRK